MGIIKAIKLGFDYIKYGEDEKDNEKIRAIDGIDIDVEKGSVIAILGHNGSGKSTLAKHMNALLLPSEGTMWVDGMDTKGDRSSALRLPASLRCGRTASCLTNPLPCWIRTGGRTCSIQSSI